MVADGFLVNDDGRLDGAPSPTHPRKNPEMRVWGGGLNVLEVGMSAISHLRAPQIWRFQSSVYFSELYPLVKLANAQTLLTDKEPAHM